MLVSYLHYYTPENTRFTANVSEYSMCKQSSSAFSGFSCAYAPKKKISQQVSS
jgi:hypothetical protein